VTDNSAVATKSAIRARVLEARRAVPPHLHDAEARALAGHLEQLAGNARTVCAYLPVGDEPGSAAMLDGLTRRGIRVLLPVVRTGDDGGPLALLWGDYRPDTLVSARFGLLEPAPPWLPAETRAEAPKAAAARPAGAGAPADPLTAREAQILALLAEGLVNKQIAARLGISRHTVKTHVGALFHKLGVTTRAEAVAAGARAGVILL
jgi:DNA-binding CsgD family transcriptional regulator